MSKVSGPRRQVLTRRRKASATSVPEGQGNGLLKPLSLSPPRLPLSLKAKPVHTSARPRQAPAPVSTGQATAPNVQIHTSSTPALVEDQPYTINVKQDIQYTDVNGKTQEADQSNLSFTKKFVSLGSKSVLDSSLIHSVYPPTSHSDYWNILPHVLFHNPETPWLFKTPWMDGDPWFALFVFTHDELLVSDDNLDAIASPIKTHNPTIKLTQGSTLSIAMRNADFQSLAPGGASALGSGTAWGTAQTQAIFIQTDLFQSIMPRDKTKSPWLMSHVRSVDVTGMTDMDATDSGTFAVTVSQRMGVVNPTASTAVYAHLVVIPGRDGSGTAPTNVGLTGLCSLYSWSYTCLPFAGLSVQQRFQDLGDSIQPLKMPAQILADAAPNLEPWILDRLNAGYSLARYRTLTGEVTMAIMRGLLIPGNPYDGDSASLTLSSSDFGGDLAIIDKTSGLMDLTYHMAWTLGRSLAMSDRSFSAALMRIRGAIHNVNLKATKKNMDKNSVAPVHKPIADAMKALPDSRTSLISSSKATKTSNFQSRWSKSTLRPSSRDIYSFAHLEVKEEYKKGLPISAYNVATAASSDPRNPNSVAYDETTPPASTDWATVFAWIMDKWYLGGIPILHLIPDPSFVPKESIRTFYIDPVWLRSLFDGALSIAEHYTEEDDARDAIKAAFEIYLVSNQAGTDRMRPAQLPRFGLFLRSELIKKFPNLHVTAPYTNNYQNWQKLDDAVRLETLDEDLLLVLFDRVPGTDEFESGITIQPPGHQLCFNFGNGTWSFSNSEQAVTHDWRGVLVPQYNGQVNPQGDGKTQYSSTSSPARGFDFKYNVLLPTDLGADARASVSIGAANDSLSSLLGSQLIAAFPKLTILDVPSCNFVESPCVPLQRTGWTCTVDNEQGPGNTGVNVLDDDPTTFWHTEWQDGNPPGPPHTITIDMKAYYKIGGLTYLPRQDGTLNGTIGQWEVWVSIDDQDYETIATGSWSLDSTLKTAKWNDPALARFVRLKAINGFGVWSSAAEINILSSETTLPPNTLKTAKRAPIQKYPPLLNQDPRPNLPPPPEVADSSPLPSLTEVQPPSLLSVLAQVNLNDATLFARYIQGAQAQQQLNTSPSNYLQHMLNCFVYTLRSPIGSSTTYKVVKPKIPAYPLDLRFDLHMIPSGPDPHRILEKVIVNIPIGDSRPCLLLPFPNESPSSNPVTTPGGLNDAYVDAPIKNRGTGIRIPNVRFTGKGQRYSIQTSLNYSSKDGVGNFYITLYPVLTPTALNADAQRLYNNPDLSFVIEGVEVSGTEGWITPSKPGQTYSVFIEEHYTSWDQQSGSTGVALGQSMIPVYLLMPNY